tara:strand:+ start:1288 stop:1581 length:294 start_codon:yes stop_codon:yes gene_type:complete
LIKKDLIVGIIFGLLSNLIGVILTVFFLFQEINIFKIFNIIENSFKDNLITKLISLGATVNLITFFIFLKFNHIQKARGILLSTFLLAILTIYLNNF